VTRTLHVETWGEVDAPRVICLHGVTGRGAGWHRLATGWLAEYHVIGPDLIGHGASPYEPPWSIEEHLDTIVSTVGAEPAAWIGHSYGARIALELAASRPELVERLVLLDPAILLDPQIALHVAELAREDRSYASFEEGVERRFTESGLRRTPKESVAEDMEGFLVADHDGRWRYRYSQAAVVASYGEMSSAPPPFEEARVPTLLVLGKDSYVRYDDLLEPHRAVLGDLLEVVTVPGGHTVLWDALEETSSAIAAFLRP
jgi:lipase